MNSIMINGVKYVKESSIEAEYANFTGDQSVATRLIGKKVIVRSVNEGINAGIVVLADETGIELRDCRRIWFHKPIDKLLSWYEGVSTSGISKDSKVSGTVLRKIIVENYSATICTDTAFDTIMELKPHGQK